MSDEHDHDPLRVLLRAGDPAAGDELDPQRRVAMKARILAAHRSDRRDSRWLLSAAAAAALLALALGLAWQRPATLPAPAAPATAMLAASPAGGGRQIQFTTENGTLVVWVLQPRETS